MVLGSVFGVRTLKLLWNMAMLATLSVLLIGCSMGGESSSPSPDATPLPTAQPTPTPAAQLGTVTWTTALAEDGEPVEDLHAFPRDTAVVHAVVQIEAVPAGERLTATWSLDGVAIDGINATVTIDEASGQGWVSFSLTWEGEALWPIGVLGVTISAESGAATSGEIQIEST